MMVGPSQLTVGYLAGQDRSCVKKNGPILRCSQYLPPDPTQHSFFRYIY